MAQKEKINRLKIVLAEKEILQKDFAEMMSLSVHTISKICKNEAQPRLTTLRKMGVILEIDIRDLLVSTPAKKN